MQKRYLFYRLRTLFSISIIWVIFGIVFFENLLLGLDLGVQISLFQFVITYTIAGTLISAALIFYLKPAFTDKPFWLSALIKLALTVLLFFIIAFILLLLYYVSMYNKSFEEYIRSFFAKILETRTFYVFMLDMGITTLLTILLLEITDKYGPGMFWSVLIGEYHKPIIQNRIFIFLDINESTSIAEQLGHEKYFRMLRRFFADITIPVLVNDGEIYQYVGDEIVLTWPNTPENKQKSIKFIRNTYYLIERYKEQYLKRYGKVPRFKTGVHVGEVTAGFIGVIKRDLLYSGDTINTAARIRSMCNELNEPFILSEDFMHDFSTPHGYNIDEIGTIELKGRSEPTKLYALKFE